MSRENLEGMKEAAGDYYRYALEARREYLRLLGKSDKEVAKLYHASLRRILWEWRRGKNKGLVYLLEAIDEDSPQFEGELAASIENAIKEGAAAGIRFSQLVTMASFEEAGISEGPMIKAFEWCRKQAVNACYARTHKDGLPLSDRIWKTTKETRNTMKAIIQAGVGEDAVKIARALEMYVKQGKTAACLHYPNMMKRMKSRVPENLDYNALRLARTELSAAYGEATRAAAEASPAIGKVKWVLSGAHPKEDICDNYAKGGDGHGVYEAKNCPIYPAHPNCLCNLQPAPDKLEDFLKKLKEWEDDPSSHPEFEEWYQKTYKKFGWDSEKGFSWVDRKDIIESKEPPPAGLFGRTGEPTSREERLRNAYSNLKKTKERYEADTGGLSGRKQKDGDIANIRDKMLRMTHLRLKNAWSQAKKSNPQFSTGLTEWTTNCQRCVPAWEMRMRGYNVEALPQDSAEEDDLLYKWRNIFAGAVWNKCSGNGYVDCVNFLEEWGDGARAEIYIRWKTGVAHTFVGQNIDGNIFFFDPQSGNCDASGLFLRGAAGSIEICRLDTLEPNGMLIEQCCKEVAK